MRYGRFVSAVVTLAIIAGCDRVTSPPPVTARAQSGLEDVLATWEDDGQATAVAAFINAVQDAEEGELKLYPMTEQEFANLPRRDRDEIRRRIMRTGESLMAFAKAASQVAITAREEGRNEEADRIADSLFRVARANVEEPTTLLARKYASAVEQYGERARGTEQSDDNAGGAVSSE